MLESLSTSPEGMSLFVVKSGFPCCFGSFLPYGSFKSLVFSSNIGKLIFDLLELGVVNVDTVFVMVDGSIHCLEDISPLSNESLSFWRCLEFSVKFGEFSNLWRFTPLLEGGLYVSDFLGVLDMIPGGLNVVPFLLDWCRISNMNLEEIHILLPLFWNISDLNVLL